jgi:outer membrane receptor protein involved in Fe transport
MHRLALSSTAALVAAMLAAPVQAQVKEPDAASSPESLATAPSAAEAADATEQGREIVVTGSRLASGFAMPTPVTVVSSEDLQKTAPNSIAESLRQIPALSNSVLSTNSGTASGVSQTNGQSLLNLRTLGSNRTLVLLDGARLGPTNVVNSVDINIIPQELVKRVDVVTGGASASYGSDAVSGVVNFILDTRYQGLKGELSAGATTRGDGGNWHASGTFGHAFGDNFHVVGSVDIFRLRGIPFGFTDRDWQDNPVGQWPNPVAGATPTSLTLPGTRSSVASYGGVISAVSGCPAGATGNACRAFANQQFLPGGGLAPFNKGEFAGTQYAQGGDGALVTNGLTPDIKRESFFAHAEFDAAPGLTLWAQGIYARNFTRNEGQTPVQNLQTVFRIFEGNPYLPASIASVFDALPGTQSFTLSRSDLDMDRVTVRGVSRVARGAGGLKGKLSDRWSFDTTVAFQRAKQELDIYNTVQRNLYAAADAVRNPQTGQIVCRSQFFTPSGTFVPGGTGQDPGCVPMNLFGNGAVTQEASDYVMDWNTADIVLKQTTAELNVRGDLGDRFNLGAGPISVALGGAWRRLTADRTVDALSAINIDFTGLRVCSPTSTPACPTTLTAYPSTLQGRYGGYQFYNPSPLSGEISVYEAYGELGVPILRDKPLFRSLDATLAGRYTHYSQSGWEPTWKLGLNWTVVDGLRLRSTYSADSRAPSVLELFNTASVTQGRNRVPCITCTGSIVSAGQNIALGNPDLSPEKARTLTAGMVLSPRFAPGLQVSVDYYQIKLRDSIIALGPQNIVDLCYQGEQVACSQITVNGHPITTTTGITANDFVVVFDRLLNFARERTSGIDFEVAYRRPLGSGRFSANLSGNYLIEAKLRSGCATTVGVNLVGYIASCGATFGSFPRIKARLGLNWENDWFGAFLQERYISGGKKDPTLVEGVDISENDVKRTFYTDLNFNLRPEGKDGRLELFFQITNLFDQDPRPTLVRSRSSIEPSDLNLYDALGRRFVAGVRINLR